ncbi:hypothetical protein NDU88_005541 [Pleurodeles waltl]|uniref:Uncharacterized protein n=1 Tax=Pleurodeles waltl TaxID=8319 RepID=A0AAV7TBW2_PLEWA|nr:hypothetical protein NDU88_005541 [Pleurodeles waltl]
MRSREHGPSHQAEAGKEQRPNSPTEWEVRNSSTNVSGEVVEPGGLKIQGRKDTWAARRTTKRWLGGAVRLGTTAPSWNPPAPLGDHGSNEGPLQGAGGERRGLPR